jgi:hypothetical protein
MSISNNSQAIKKLEKKTTAKKNTSALNLVEKKKETSQKMASDNINDIHATETGIFTHKNSNRGK